MLAEGSLINGDDELAIVHAHAIKMIIPIYSVSSVNSRCIAWLGRFDLNLVNGRNGSVIRMRELVERIIEYTAAC